MSTTTTLCCPEEDPQPTAQSVERFLHMQACSDAHPDSTGTLIPGCSQDSDALAQLEAFYQEGLVGDRDFSLLYHGRTLTAPGSEAYA